MRQSKMGCRNLVCLGEGTWHFAQPALRRRPSRSSEPGFHVHPRPELALPSIPGFLECEQQGLRQMKQRHGPRRASRGLSSSQKTISLWGVNAAYQRCCHARSLSRPSQLQLGRWFWKDELRETSAKHRRPARHQHGAFLEGCSQPA